MRLKKKGISAVLIWILCIICILFSGICCDNVPADLCLAYQETALVSAERDPVVTAFSTPQKEDASVFSTPQKGVPTQAYVPKGQVQGNSALAPRKTVQRANLRCRSGNAAGILPERIFSGTHFLGQTARSFDGLCEVFSNTVILQYIHRQDGEK